MTQSPPAHAIARSARILAWARRRGPLRGIQPMRALQATVGTARFVRDWYAYQRLPGAEPLDLSESFPQLSDATAATEFDPHYFYQAVWLAKHLAGSRPTRHVDVGSDHRMVGMLTSVAPVAFVDIRPLHVQVDGLACVAGSILALPFASRSVSSLSCLHVAEHVGLGRYGDPLEPAGTRRAMGELGRVLAPGGSLFFSVPTGRSRVQFNAHRVLSPDDVIEGFRGLELIEFAAVNDAGAFVPHATPSDFRDATYSCGMFHFQRTADGAR